MVAEHAEPVRLVIWDLDETFWQGTLTEGGIQYDRTIHDIVVELARRIVSSICSKNDFAAVKAILHREGPGNTSCSRASTGIPRGRAWPPWWKAFSFGRLPSCLSTTIP